MKPKVRNPVTCSISFVLMLAVVFAVILSDSQEARAETNEVWTSLYQKDNPSYDTAIQEGLPASYKVRLGKNVITIYGSVRNYGGSNAEGSRHTWKLAKKVKFVSSGGTDPEHKMSKKEFQVYLKKVKDTGLALVLELKNGKVVKAAVSS